MNTKGLRQTVDLTANPDLVVIYLGMKVNAFMGLKTVMGLGPQIVAAGESRPEGLLHCEQNIILVTAYSHSMSGCAGIGVTSSRWRLGRVRSLIARGGRSF